jgi:hypothetical protein
MQPPSSGRLNLAQVEADLQYPSEPDSSTLTKGLHLNATNLGLKDPKNPSQYNVKNLKTVI